MSYAAAASEEEQQSHWVLSLEHRKRVSSNTPSARGSVDFVLIEDFSDSNSESSDHTRRQVVGAVGSGSETSVELEPRWTSRIISAALRPLIKSRAKRLVTSLIEADKRDGPHAREQRFKAARGLLDIAEQESEGVDIVARRLIKKSSRRRKGVRALFKLSDEEPGVLDSVPTSSIPRQSYSLRLLSLLVASTKESLLLKTITSLMRGATDGATAVLYLTSKVDLGAFNIDQNLVLDFGARVVREDNSVTKKWFSGLSLLVASLEQTSANGFSHLAGVLHVTITNAIEGTVKEEALDAECEAIKDSISSSNLPTIRTLFTEISLHTRPLEIREEDAAEARDTRKWLREKLDRGIINALSRLPELSFESALASALEKALLKLKSPGSNAYEPLEIVERLLWLSNLKENAEEIHSALVKSDACVFLTRILSYDGGLGPHDRGIWRAKGLTMTCLGNIVEEMDWVQLRDHATTEMIGIVVTIKHTEDAPLVQKGQAIFLLQRYTLVADRYGIDPHYRETISG